MMFLLAPRAILMAWSKVMGIWFLTPSLAGFVSATVSAIEAAPVKVKIAKSITSILMAGIKINDPFGLIREVN